MDRLGRLVALLWLIGSCVLMAQSQDGPTIPNLPDVNHELLKLVVADQWDRGMDMFSGRQVKPPDSLPWEQIEKNDAERRAAVRALLNAGQIQTGRNTSSRPSSSNIQRTLRIYRRLTSLLRAPWPRVTSKHDGSQLPLSTGCCGTSIDHRCSGRNLSKILNRKRGRWTHIIANQSRTRSALPGALLDCQSRRQF